MTLKHLNELGGKATQENDNPGSAFNSFEALAADLLQFPSDEEIPPQMHGYLARWAWTFVKHHGDVTRASLKYTEGKMIPVPESGPLLEKLSEGVDVEAVKREVIAEYGGNGIVNRSVLEDIEWAIDHISREYDLVRKDNG